MPAIPLVDIDDVLETTLEGIDIQTGAQILNRVHHTAITVPTPAVDTLFDAASSIGQFWVANVLPILSEDYLFKSATTRRISGAVPATPTPRVPHPFDLSYDAIAGYLSPIANGALLRPSLPVFVTASVRFQSTIPARYFRGGMRLSPITTDQQNTTFKDQLSVAAQGDIDVAIDAFTGTILLPGFTLLEFALFSGTYLAWVDGNVNPPFIATTTVTGIQTSLFLRSQLTRQAPRVP